MDNLLNTFLETLKDDALFLETSLAEKPTDWRKISDRAHRLAGASITLGYDALASALRVLEYAIQKGVADESHLGMLAMNCVNVVGSTIEEVDEDISFEVEPDVEDSSVDVSTSGVRCLLVVDDDPVTRLLVSSKLGKYGFEVLEAENGQEAVYMVQEHEPDVVLMDGCMPVMDGFEAVAKIRELPKVADTAIFMLTGLTDDESLHVGKSLNIQAYITKPFTVDDILEHISQL